MGDTAEKKSVIDKLAAIIGIVGSAITVVLTLQNNQTKRQIDEAQQLLQERSQRLQEAAQALEVEIKRRATTVEEAREKVDRYKWIYTLVPNLSDQKNAVNRATTLAMIRLALDRQDADALLSGLTQSSDTALRTGAQEGQQTLLKIDNAELRSLVELLNAGTVDARRSSTARIERDYAGSASAVGLVLERLQKLQAEPLSPAGLVNALYFLSRTQRTAWPPENLSAWEAVRAALGQVATGTQSKALLAQTEKQVASYRP